MRQTKKLTLLNPESWDDANDSHFLKLYKSAWQLTCLAALCFSEADETYHHWRIFAAGSSGVRIEFDGERLFAALDVVPEIRREKVEYRLIRDLKKGAPIEACGRYCAKSTMLPSRETSRLGSPSIVIQLHYNKRRRFLCLPMPWFKLGSIPM